MLVIFLALDPRAAGRARQPRTTDRIDLMARDGPNRGLHRQCRSFVADCRIALIVGIIAVLAAPANAAAARQAAVLEVDGAIGPGIAGYVVRALGGVRPSDTGVVVLRLDTPGGLDTSMRDIVRAILASPVPVVAYVAPSGARA